MGAISIGAPDSRLTIHNCHRGSVFYDDLFSCGEFSGDVSEQSGASYDLYFEYSRLIAATFNRTEEEKITFLSKIDDMLFLLKSPLLSCLLEEQDQQQEGDILGLLHKGQSFADAFFKDIKKEKKNSYMQLKDQKNSAFKQREVFFFG